MWLQIVLVAFQLRFSLLHVTGVCAILTMQRTELTEQGPRPGSAEKVELVCRSAAYMSSEAFFCKSVLGPLFLLL